MVMSTEVDKKIMANLSRQLLKIRFKDFDFVHAFFCKIQSLQAYTMTEKGTQVSKEELIEHMLLLITLVTFVHQYRLIIKMDANKLFYLQKLL